MENKINIAQLLKDCPKGMELDCTMLDDVVFEKISFGVPNHPIVLKRLKTNTTIYLTKYGQYSDAEDYKCVIFPKGKTTWEGFVPPCKFKDGDVVYIKTKGHNQNKFIIIFKEIKNDHIHKHACFAYQVLYTCKNAVCHLVDVEIMRLATEEEKQELFQAIKDNGYKWNAENKTLERFIKPKFKVGDRIVHKVNKESPFIITEITNDCYKGGTQYEVLIEQQNNFELVPYKFDINSLVPFESRVLVRDNNTEKWKSNFWGFYDIDSAMCFPYECGGSSFAQCIPYEGNEHLLGKTNDCDNFYKTWE